MAKNNWSKIKDKGYTETAQGRDVYNEQQLGRGKLQEKQTMTARTIIAIVLSVFAAFMMYLVWAGVVQMSNAAENVENVCEIHQDADDNDICDVCGMHDLSELPQDKVMTIHEDLNEDTLCDKCGAHYRHSDEDGDFYCDYDNCDVCVHPDENKDNKCDNPQCDVTDITEARKLESIGTHAAIEDASASTSGSSSSGSDGNQPPSGSLLDYDYSWDTGLYTDGKGNYWDKNWNPVDANGNPITVQEQTGGNESSEGEAVEPTVVMSEDSSQVQKPKEELGQTTVTNEDGSSDIHYKDENGNNYRTEHLDAGGNIVSAEESSPIVNRETGDIIYHNSVTKKEYYERGMLVKAEYFTPTVKMTDAGEKFYDPYLIKTETFEKEVAVGRVTIALDPELEYLDTFVKSRNSNATFSEAGDLIQVDVYEDADYTCSEDIVCSELYSTVEVGDGTKKYVKYKVAYYATSSVGVTYVNKLEYYSSNNINTHTQFLNESQVVTNDDYWRGDGSVKKRLVYNPEKDKLVQTEYYDTEGNLTEVVPYHGFMYPKSTMQVIASILAGLLVFMGLYQILKKNLLAQNMLSDTEDINQYTNDQHIALPEEIQRKYDWFPDVGAHSSVLVSSMISHMALKNKGINPVMVASRYKKDVVDEDGNVIYYKGEIMYDENGNAIMEEKPMFDEDFSDALFEASNAPKEVRISYDTRMIPYNPDNANREKLQGKEDSSKFIDKLKLKWFKKPLPKVSKYDTVTDLINKDWFIPEYEPQRPAGAYIVDTAPVNTMVLAITRAGKGQTVIEPTIDMWTREKRGNNMVINDPKGELLVKFYTRGTFRGYQIVQFNLINAMKTDIYNPLGMAAQSAREGDFTKCAMYVENIAEVFFPLDGGDDPVWPNAANNAFKRAAYGLIDYYLEEERKYRNECNAAIAKGKYIDPQVIETNIDQMWGKVTLYNCYQMFTQLTSKKITNPAKEFAQKMKSGGFEGVPEEEVAAEAERVNVLSDLWAGAPEADCLTLYFSATEKLPNNSMRTLVSNVNNALKAMAGAEKMMASVYGIAITAMSFFTDPTISTLTSGTPSQTVDLAGFSFPRRFGVRFHPDYITKNHYIGLQCKWDAFEDKEFTKSLGKLFEHSDIVSREGWARYFFDGKFEKDTAYVRLRLFNASTSVLVHTYYFEFHKGYQTSLDGRTYIKDPLLGTKIAKNGAIRELLPSGDKFVAGSTTFKRKHLAPIDDNSKDVRYQMEDEVIPCITQSYVRYAEKPKMCFLVTPPHLMKYAKLILILIKQLVDLNFDQSYMTKENQKPLYKTRFMLDELGNLQSEGHGISGFETMLSIGLGQEQQFTLILQTLQQLKDVYGDSVDKIVKYILLCIKCEVIICAVHNEIIM